MVICTPSTKRKFKNLNVLPDEIEVCPFVVAVDTREQSPWTFQEMVTGQKQLIVKREVKTLHTGDYSIVGHEQKITVERKSVGDLLSSITHGHGRFKYEHERMTEITMGGGFACVVIEGCLAAICDELNDPNSGRRIRPTTVMGIVAAWPRRYNVPWFFAGDRRRAELLGFRILYKWWGDRV